jgi:hypothetical protein
MSASGRTYSDIAAAEIRLQTSYVSDCEPQLRLVEQAMLLLDDLMSSVEPPDGSPNPGEIGMPHPESRPERFMLYTQMMIGARALRVVQAARPALAAGYELEALVFDRILVELMTHRRQVLLDATGDEARQWLQSPRGRGIGKRIAKVAKGDLYDLQSRAAHGDSRLLEPLLDAERNTLTLAPARSDLTRASLVLHASFLTDQIEIVAALAGLKHPDLAPMQEAVRVQWQKFRPDQDSSY